MQMFLTLGLPTFFYPTLPTGNCRTLPQRDTETAKNDKSAFGSDALD